MSKTKTVILPCYWRIVCRERDTCMHVGIQLTTIWVISQTIRAYDCQEEYSMCELIIVMNYRMYMAVVL